MNCCTLLLCPQLSPQLTLLRGAGSEQPYLFHPDMEDLIYLGKTLAYLYSATFSFQCLFLKGRLSCGCRSPHQEEPHFSGGKFSAWVLSRVL